MGQKKRKRIREGALRRGCGPGVAVSEVGARVDVEVVAPQHVLVGDVARAVGGEVAGIAREAQGAVVDRVDRNVAAGDTVAEATAGAQTAEHRRSTAAQ